MLKLKVVAEAIKDYRSEFPEHFMVTLGTFSFHQRMDNLLEDLEAIAKKDTEIENHMAFQCKPSGPIETNIQEKPGGIVWVKVFSPDK